MKVIQLDAFGIEHLSVQEQAVPALKSGEVRVKTHASGVNPIDWKTCTGGGAAPFIGDLPFIPGWEMSGIVEAVAEDVSDFSPGDRVLGMLRFPERAGCYAEYVNAPASQLAHCPDVFDLTTAAGLPIAGLTAWQALFEKGQLQSGQRVLITAAAGGVGHLAVQLARHAGAEVIATASPVNHDWLMTLGADRCVDYHTGTLAAQVEDVDLIIDGVGGDSGEAALACLAANGVLVTLPSVTKDQLIAAGEKLGKRVEAIRATPDSAQLSRLAARCAEGQLTLEIAQQYPLAEVQTAFADSAAGHTRGKRVLTLGV